MGITAIPLDQVLLYDRDEDGLINPERDHFTDTQGRDLPPDAPEIKELQQKLKLASWQGCRVFEADADYSLKPEAPRGLGI